MSRGDLVYARLDISLFFDPSFRRLPSSAKVLYLACYSIAVERRTSVLPVEFDARACSDRAGVEQRSGRQALQYCIDSGRLRRLPDGRIHVPGVRGNHRKITGWTVLPDEPSEPGDTIDSGTLSAPHRAGNGLREQSREREETRTEHRLESETKDLLAGNPDSSISSSVLPATCPERRPTPAPPSFSGMSSYEAVRFAVTSSKKTPQPQLEAIAQSKPVDRVLAAMKEVYRARCEGRVHNPGGLAHKLLMEIHE